MKRFFVLFLGLFLLGFSMTGAKAESADYFDSIVFQGNPGYSYDKFDKTWEYGGYNAYFLDEKQDKIYNLYIKAEGNDIDKTVEIIFYAGCSFYPGYKVTEYGRAEKIQFLFNDEILASVEFPLQGNLGGVQGNLGAVVLGEKGEKLVKALASFDNLSLKITFAGNDEKIIRDFETAEISGFFEQRNSDVGNESVGMMCRKLLDTDIFSYNTMGEGYTDDAAYITFENEELIDQMALQADPTASPTPEPTATPKPTPEPTATPEPTPEPTATPEPTPEPTATPEPTPEPTATPEPTPEPTATPEPVVYYAPENADRSLTVQTTDLTVNVGQQTAIQVGVAKRSEDAPDKSRFVWAVSDTGIAKVNASGAVTGISPGMAVIKCSLEDNPDIYAEIIVYVIQPVKSIQPENKSVSLLVGGSEEASRDQVTVSILPENATHKECTFVSSDDTVVTVDDFGNLRAVSPGKASITIIPAKEESAVKATVNVTVGQAVTKINLPKEQTVAKGKTVKLEASVLPDSASNKKVEYESSNPAVAKVTAAGSVSALKCGKAVITCKATDGSGISSQCEITVIQAVTGLKLQENKMTLLVGKSRTVRPTITPADATNKKLQWTSSNSSVATVTDGGTITANRSGDCVITGRTLDGSEKNVSVNVHVPTFHVNRTEYTVTSKSGLTIPVVWDSRARLTLNPSSCAYFNAKWDSSSDGIIITPLNAGRGTLTIMNEQVRDDTVTITVNINNSAVYNKSSYPAIQYKDAMRYPDRYKNSCCSFSGMVLQVMYNDNGTTTYRVSSKGRYSDVVYVIIQNSAITTPVIEDDKVTVYGRLAGNYTYTSVQNVSITIPLVNAERVDVK